MIKIEKCKDSRKCKCNNFEEVINVNWLITLKKIDVEILDNWRVLISKLHIVDSNKSRLKIMLISFATSIRE